jgi:hypothetical protein
MSAKRERGSITIAEVASRGGKAWVNSLTPEQLRATNRERAAKRWAQATPEQRAAHGVAIAKGRQRAAKRRRQQTEAA